MDTRLAELERQIEERQTDIGLALAEIKRSKLYKDTHPSWEAYCRDRWGWGKSWCDRLIRRATQEDGYASTRSEKSLQNSHNKGAAVFGAKQPGTLQVLLSEVIDPPEEVAQRPADEANIAGLLLADPAKVPPIVVSKPGVFGAPEGKRYRASGANRQEAARRGGFPTISAIEYDGDFEGFKDVAWKDNAIHGVRWPADKLAEGIAERHRAGRSVSEIARMFNVAQSVVRDAIKGEEVAQEEPEARSLKTTHRNQIGRHDKRAWSFLVGLAVDTPGITRDEIRKAGNDIDAGLKSGKSLDDVIFSSGFMAAQSPKVQTTTRKRKNREPRVRVPDKHTARMLRVQEVESEIRAAGARLVRAQMIVDNTTLDFHERQMLYDLTREELVDRLARLVESFEGDLDSALNRLLNEERGEGKEADE